MGATDPGSAREEAERLVATALAAARLAAAGSKGGQWGPLGGIVSSVLGHSGSPGASAGPPAAVSPPARPNAASARSAGASPPCAIRVPSSPSASPPARATWPPGWPACCARSPRPSPPPTPPPGRRPPRLRVAGTTTCGARPPVAGMILSRHRNGTSGPPPRGRRTRPPRPPYRPSTSPGRPPRGPSGRPPTGPWSPRPGHRGRGRTTPGRRGLTNAHPDHAPVVRRRRCGQHSRGEWRR